MRRPIAFLVACVLSTVACAPSPQDRSGEPTPTEPPVRRIVVGVASDMPGLGTYQGYRWSGFEIALYQWLGSHSDPPFTPVPTPIPISDRVNAILDGRVDLVIEAFSITDRRREDVHFAGPYLITKQGFMVRTGDHISSPDQRYGIGLAKGDVALCAALTARIKEFVVDGHWDRLFAEHFGDPLRSADFKPDVDRLDRCD